jgi:acetyl esterase/lipase
VQEQPNLRYAGSSANPLRLDAFLPKESTPLAGVIVVHGGGWSAGSRRSVDAFARRLADLGWDAFAIDYRLAPRYRFPAAVDDVEASLRWLGAHARQLHLEPTKIALLGFSAGANLALQTALSFASSTVHVSAVAAWSAPTDLARFTRESRSQYALRSISAYLGCSPSACASRYRDASPVFHLTRHAPPIFLANSAHEIVPLPQARELIAKARAAKVPASLLVVPGSGHASQYTATAWLPTVRFLRRYLN